MDLKDKTITYILRKGVTITSLQSGILDTKLNIWSSKIRIYEENFSYKNLDFIIIFKLELKLRNKN